MSSYSNDDGCHVAERGAMAVEQGQTRRSFFLTHDDPPSTLLMNIFNLYPRQSSQDPADPTGDDDDPIEGTGNPTGGGDNSTGGTSGGTEDGGTSAGGTGGTSEETGGTSEGTGGGVTSDPITTPPPDTSTSVTTEPTLDPTTTDPPTTSDPPTTTVEPETTSTLPPVTRTSTVSSFVESSTFISTSTSLSATETASVVVDNSTLTSSDTEGFFTTTLTSDGSTIVTTLPTSLLPDSSSDNGANRAALIGGTTAAAVVILILVIGAIFVYKRSQKRRITFMEALKRGKREGKGAGGVGLLDGEFDDEEEERFTGQMRYRDHVRAGSVGMHSPSPSMSLGVIPRSTTALNISPTTPTSTTPPRSATTPLPVPSTATNSPTPSLFRARASDSGSIFHESGVWPPPVDGFVDPLTKAGNDVVLSKIVDDVMGPSAAAPVLSVANPSPASPQPKDSERVTSQTSSLYRDPFRDLSHSQSSSASVYYDNASSTESHSAALALPPGAAPPKRPSPLVQEV